MSTVVPRSSENLKGHPPTQDIAFADVQEVLMADGWHRVVEGTFVGGTNERGAPVRFFLWLEAEPGDVVKEVMAPTSSVLAMRSAYVEPSNIQVVPPSALHHLKTH